MRFVLTLAWLTLALGALAQEAPIVRRDTQFPVEVRTNVNTKSAKPGAVVEFRTTIAVLIGNNIVVPNDTKILGTIEEVRSNAADNPHSLLRIRIHTLLSKYGESRLNAVVMAVDPIPAFTEQAARRSFGYTQTFLEGIHIVAHLTQNAATELASQRKNFTLHSGTRFVLRHLDAEPAMMDKNASIDVRKDND